MGNQDEEADRFNDETRHTVIISKPFCMGKEAVTAGVFRVFVNVTRESEL